MTETVEGLLKAWLLARYREAGDSERHLRICPETVVVDHEVTDGTYGCDTGCEFLRWSVTVQCPHHERHEVNDGEFGDMRTVITGLEELEHRLETGGESHG